MKMQCARIYFLHVSEVLSRSQLRAGFTVGWTIILLSLLCILTGCSRGAPTAPEVVRPVKTIVLTPGGEIQTRTFSGRALASQEAELTFQVPGLLIRLPVREGQRLARGDLVA